MKRLCCLILVTLLMLSSAAGSETLQLIPADPVTLPAEAADEELSPRVFLGLSPDGKTLLTFTSEEVPLSEEEKAAAAEKAQKESGKETGSNSLPGRVKKQNSSDVSGTQITFHFCLIRDGELIPVKDNMEFGCGDPYQQLEKIKKRLSSFPGLNGLSWSEDGRYITLSDITMALSNMPACIPVIDTVSKEVWLAQSYNNNVLAEDFGSAYLTTMSRDGRYVYYISLSRDGGDPFFCFCRCATADGSREILCKTSYSDPMGYRPDSASNLVETADGSWLLSGLSGTEKSKDKGIALIRFAPAGDEWKADILPTMIPDLLASARFVYSPTTGYGLMLAFDNTRARAAMQVEQEMLISGGLPAGLARHVNLIRFHPGQDMHFDTWCMQRTGDTVDDMEMVSGAEYLAFLLTLASDMPIVPPPDYSAVEEMRNPGPIIYNLCWSPDGRNALLAVKTNLSGSNSLELYLLDPETMELRHVESPDNLIDMSLAAGSQLGTAYRPGISWNPDGTIVLLTGNGKISFFRLIGY